METALSANPVTLVECPRDAMQGWAEPISTENKVRYLNALLRVGFSVLDFGSFVSPRSIPQMADTQEVLNRLDLSGSKTSLLAIVANTRGAEEAVKHEQIRYLGFPFSLSPTFQLRNTNSSMEESLQRVDAIQESCLASNKELVVYLSMGFGNPYGDAYSREMLEYWAGEMATRGIGILSLADTVGLATPDQIGEALQTLVPKYPAMQIGVHLHATAENHRSKLSAAYTAGCRRFDGAINGIGGCPMAQDALVGNMDTLQMIPFFEELGVLSPINQEALRESVEIANEIFV